MSLRGRIYGKGRSELILVESIHVFDVFIEISHHCDLIDSMELAMVFGSFLNVHEGSHGFSSSVPSLFLVDVLTNEPGYCKSTRCTS